MLGKKCASLLDLDSPILGPLSSAFEAVSWFLPDACGTKSHLSGSSSAVCGWAPFLCTLVRGSQWAHLLVAFYSLYSDSAIDSAMLLKYPVV